jgi:ketosteroid isomerase-like protein
MNNSLLKAFIVFLVLSTHADEARCQQLSFSETVSKHIDAIQNRKLSELLSTVDDRVILILPDGSLMKSKKEYEQLHIDWFADKGWKMEMTIMEKEENNELGHVLVKYKYTEEGNPPAVRYTYLSMIFKKKSGNWLLVHDQNTRITKP